MPFRSIIALIVTVLGLSGCELYPEPNQWKSINLVLSDDAAEIWLQPGVTTLWMTASVYSDPGGYSCLFWDAEQPSALSVDVMPDTRNPNYFFPNQTKLCVPGGWQFVAVRATSTVPQYFRVAWLTRRGNPIISGYHAGLCGPGDTLCYPRAALPHAADAARRIAQIQLWTKIGVVGVGVFLLHRYLDFFAIFFGLYTTIFPSARAKWVTEELKKAASDQKTFDAAATNAYHAPEPSSLRRKQDIKDLTIAHTEADREVQKLRERQQKVQAEEAERQRLVAAFEKTVVELEKLKAQIDAYKRKSDDD